MAVSTNYQPLVFSGNGSTTAFSITWQFFDSDDLTVIAIDGDGVETVQTITTHYTVSGGTDANGLPATGTVTMVTAPASGTTLRVERNTDRLQSTTWTNSGPFQAKSVEAGLDRVTLIAQESGGGNSGLTPKIDGDMLALETSGATDYYDGGAYPIRSSHTASDNDDLINKAYADANLGGAAAETAVSAAASATASATAASNAQTAAETALDSFDDRYLGAKSSDPVLDNDGDALVAGAMYFNTTSDVLRVYNGAAFQNTIDTSEVTASSVHTFTNKTISSAGNTMTITLGTATVTGTAAEFDAAVTDDNFAYQSDLGTAAAMTGPSGAIVGTTDSQTLTNKTLTAPTMTDPVINSETVDGVPWHQNNIATQINSLDADNSPDTAADYVVTYDASAGAAKKVLLEDVAEPAVSVSPTASGSGWHVGSWALCYNNSGGTVNDGSTTAGSGLELATATDGTTTTMADSTTALTGTWKNVAGVNLPSPGYGYFVRTA